MQKKFFPLFLLSVLLFIPHSQAQTKPQDKTVLLAILARNKEHTLPYYLHCIDSLDYNKKLITVYINTNNNEDNTKEILERWVRINRHFYRSVIFENPEVQGLSQTKPHEWTKERLKILGNIRNKSLQKAKEALSDYYFVVDCDNFITPCTLSVLIEKDKPIIAPMLQAIPEPNETYSNFFCDVNKNGYYKHHPAYFKILDKEIVGTFKVPVVHCTYLIETEYIDRLSYTDHTKAHEFVIFSRSARNNNVDQYICNEKEFGCLLHFRANLTLEEEKNKTQEIFRNLF
jgi:hypothetical protein